MCVCVCVCARARVCVCVYTKHNTRRLLEAKAKTVVSDLTMAEMYKRSVDQELYS